MKEVFKAIQLVTCSLAINVSPLSKRVSLAANLIRRVMIRLYQVISSTNDTVYLSENPL